MADDKLKEPRWQTSSFISSNSFINYAIKYRTNNSEPNYERSEKSY